MSFKQPLAVDGAPGQSGDPVTGSAPWFAKGSVHLRTGENVLGWTLMEYRQTKKIVIARNVMVSNEGKKIKILLVCSSTMPYSPQETRKKLSNRWKTQQTIKCKKYSGKSVHRRKHSKTCNEEKARKICKLVLLCFWLVVWKKFSSLMVRV